MCNLILLYLLLSCGCGNSSVFGRSGNGRGCNNNGTSVINGRGGNGYGGNNNDGYIQSRNSDCGCDGDRSDFTAPPWTRSSYSNGDTCGCEEA